jgi:hypothetical protein
MAAAYWSQPHRIEPRLEAVEEAPGGMLLSARAKCLLEFLFALDVDNALRRVWHVFTRSEHGVLP